MESGQADPSLGGGDSSQPAGRGSRAGSAPGPSPCGPRHTESASSENARPRRARAAFAPVDVARPFFTFGPSAGPASLSPPSSCGGAWHLGPADLPPPSSSTQDQGAPPARPPKQSPPSPRPWRVPTRKEESWARGFSSFQEDSEPSDPVFSTRTEFAGERDGRQRRPHTLRPEPMGGTPRDEIQKVEGDTSNLFAQAFGAS